MTGWTPTPNAHPLAAVASAFVLSAVFFVAIAAALPFRDHPVVIVAWGLVCLCVVVLAARRPGPLYGVPLAIAAGLAFDSFYITPRRPFDSDHWQNFVVVAMYIGLGVLVGALTEGTRRRAEVSETERSKLADEQAALRRVATLVARGVDPREVFAAAAVEMRDLLGADITTIVRFEPDATETIVAGTGGLVEPGERYDVRPPSMAAEVLRTGRTARVDDYSRVVEQMAETLGRAPVIRASVASPVVVEGKLWGAITASSRSGPLPAETEQRMAEFTELLATAIANADSRVRLDAVRGLADSLRAQAHESANQLHTLVGLVELGHYEDAVAFATEQVEVAQELLLRLQERIDEPALVALLLGKTARARERGVALEIAEDARLGATGLPATELVTILGNLIDNALDAVGDTPGARVRVALRTEDGAAVIEVRDSGPGLAPDHVERVFELGWSTKPAGARGPRGLGLALVRQTAIRLGGSVTARNEGGAVFTVRLPLRSADTVQELVG